MSGGRIRLSKRTTCGCMWLTFGRSWRPIRLNRCGSSPSPAWAIASALFQMAPGDSTFLPFTASYHSHMDKDKVAEILVEIGTLLELKGENPFKTRAYVNAARTLESLTEPLNKLVEEKRLGDIKG